MKRLLIASAVVLAALPLAASAAYAPSHPEARPFKSVGAAQRDLDAAFGRARANGRRVLAVFGGNWCHDSRALAGWFETPRFREMLRDRYELVWINVGRKDRNIDVARSLGLDGIAGTPTVLMLDADRAPLNLADAPTWRNAASRTEDDIFAALARP